MPEQSAGFSVSEGSPMHVCGHWRVMRIGDAGSLRLGRQRAPQYDRGANMRPYLRVMNIADGRVDARDLNSMHFSASDFERHRLIPGDVLITEGDLASAMNVGRSAVFRGEVPDCCIQNSLIRFRLNAPGDPSFFHFAFEHLRKHGHFAQATMSTTVFHLSAGRLATIPMAVPEEPEQRQIAAVLDTVDDAIRKTEQIIAKLKQVKQGLLHDLLTRGIDENGELRDPERHPEQFKDSPLGRIPREWEAAPIGSLLANVDPAMRSGPFGSALLKSELVPAGVPLVGIDNVHAERFDSTFTRFVTPKKAQELARYAVRPGDVMITIMGTVGRCCVVPHQIGSALSTKHVWTLTFDAGRYAPDLACAQINHAPWVLRHFARDEQGGIMSAIRSETLRTTLLPVPPAPEMQFIAGVLREITSRIAAEAELVEKLKVQKAGLTEDLLTGRVRVTSLLAEMQP